MVAIGHRHLEVVDDGRYQSGVAHGHEVSGRRKVEDNIKTKTM